MASAAQMDVGKMLPHCLARRARSRGRPDTPAARSVSPHRHLIASGAKHTATAAAAGVDAHVTEPAKRRALYERGGASGRCPRIRPLMSGGLALNATRPVPGTVFVVPRVPTLMVLLSAQRRRCVASFVSSGAIVNVPARTLRAGRPLRITQVVLSAGSARHLCRSPSPCGLHGE